jgi:hypothetical protein
MDEVIAPDVIAVLRTEPYTGTVIQPEPPAFWPTLRDLQAFPPPETFYPFVINLPAVTLQQRSNTPVSIPAMPQSQLRHVRYENGFVIGFSRYIPM